MTVANEVPPADPVDLDRRDRRAAPLSQRQLLPAGPDPVGRGPEVPVEVTPGVDRADDGVQRYRPQPQLPFAAPVDRTDYLVEGQQAAAVKGLAAQPVPQRGEDLAPLSAETRGLLDARRLALLPAGALVVNVGRGPVLDTSTNVGLGTATTAAPGRSTW
jgi:hypothetical protein